MRVQWVLWDGRRGQLEVESSPEPDELLARLMSVTGEDDFSIWHGYPPRPYKRGDSLGQTLILRRQPSLQIQTMPDDNSCLFHALGRLFASTPRAMRQLVGDLVMHSPLVDDAILGKPRAEYAAWIQADNSWGGAIELLLVANAHGCCLRSIDVQHLRLDEFNAKEAEAKVGYLLYSGIHYDLLTDKEGGLWFDSGEDWHRQAALALAKQAQREHRYTDLTHFTLTCDECGQRLSGQAAAHAHAQATGHQSFREE